MALFIQLIKNKRHHKGEESMSVIVLGLVGVSATALLAQLFCFSTYKGRK
jgi:hypothetical protein